MENRGHCRYNWLYFITNLCIFHWLYFKTNFCILLWFYFGINLCIPFWFSYPLISYIGLDSNRISSTTSFSNDHNSIFSTVNFANIGIVGTYWWGVRLVCRHTKDKKWFRNSWRQTHNIQILVELFEYYFIVGVGYYNWLF